MEYTRGSITDGGGPASDICQQHAAAKPCDYCANSWDEPGRALSRGNKVTDWIRAERYAAARWIEAGEATQKAEHADRLADEKRRSLDADQAGPRN